MNAVVPSYAFGEIERLAHSIARSGLFGMKTPEQAIALMAIAQAEGRHPAIAARDYDIIEGRPAKKAEAMARDFLESGGTIEWHALSDTIADATFSHPKGGTVRITWDWQRAVTAQLAGKNVWKKYPRQMLRSRVVSEGVRTVWPLATSGMYVPEEAADMQPLPAFTGTTLEHTEPVAETAQDQAANAAAAAARDQANRAATVDPLDETNPTQWLRNLEALVAGAQTLEALHTITRDARVVKALEAAPTLIRGNIADMLRLAHERLAPGPEVESQTVDDAAEEGDRWPAAA
jgi:hypothetical protein